MNLEVPKLCFTRKEEPFQSPTYPPKSSQPALVTGNFVSRERHFWYFLHQFFACKTGVFMLGLTVAFKEKAESTSVYKSSEEHRSGRKSFSRHWHLYPWPHRNV